MNNGKNRYTIIETNKFKKQLKRATKRGLKIERLREVVNKLANGVKLPTNNRDHALVGDWLGFRECHIDPDWLLVYRVEAKDLILVLWRTGTHSDLRI